MKILRSLHRNLHQSDQAALLAKKITKRRPRRRRAKLLRLLSNRKTKSQSLQPQLLCKSLPLRASLKNIGAISSNRTVFLFQSWLVKMDRSRSAPRATNKSTLCICRSERWPSPFIPASNLKERRSLSQIRTWTPTQMSFLTLETNSMNQAWQVLHLKPK